MNKARPSSSTLSLFLFLFHTSILVLGERWRPGDPCPTEIRSQIPSWRPEDKFGGMEIIHAAMLTCPNITTLELSSAGGSPCLPPTVSLAFPFSISAAQVERWASAPHVLILDDFSSNAIRRSDGNWPGPSWAVYSEGHHAPWYEDWYREYTTNRTSAKQENSEAQQPPEQQNRLGDSQVVQDNGINGLNQEGSMPSAQGLMEMGSNSSAANNASSGTPDSWAPGNETNFDVWLKVMAFSQIHTLKLGHRARWGGTYTLTTRLAETLPPHLTNLEKLELKNAIGAMFLVSLPKNVSLAHLTWREPWANENIGVSLELLMMPIFEHHGPKLETLYLHSFDTGNLRRPVLSTHQLRGLARRAPHIKKLTIDLGRPFREDWPWEDLKVLATELLNLTDLTIYFDLAYSPCQMWPYARQLLPTPGTPGVLPSVQTTRPASHHPPADSVVATLSTPAKTLPQPPRTPLAESRQHDDRVRNMDIDVDDPNPNSNSQPHPDGAEAEKNLPPVVATYPPQMPSFSMMFASSPAPKPCTATDEEWNNNCMGRKAYAQPMVNISQGEKIAAFLSAERAKTAGGNPFQRIRIRSGNDGWGVDGGYLWDTTLAGKSKWDWIDGKSSWVTCFGKEWEGLPVEHMQVEKKEGLDNADNEFVCFGGENLNELKEWEGRCQSSGSRDPERAWETGNATWHERKRENEAKRKWLLDSEREE